MSSTSARKEFEAEERIREQRGENGVPVNYLGYRYTAAGNLAAEFENNVRKSFWGNEKEDSEDYKAVKAALKAVSNKEDEDFDVFAIEKTEPGKQITMISGMLEKYEVLLAQADVYLKEKNPHGKESENRYKLVLRAEKLAKEQMKNLRTKIRSLEKIIASNEKITTKEQKKYQNTQRFVESINRRNSAVTENEHLGEAVKKTEIDICNDLMKLQSLADTDNPWVKDDGAREITAMLMARLEARSKMVNKNAVLPKESSLKKRAAEFLVSGLANSMLGTIKKTGFREVADMETSVLYRMVLKNAGDMAKEQKKSTKRDKENRKFMQRSETNKQTRDYIHAVTDHDTWGLSQAQLDVCKAKAKTKEMAQLSLDRSSVQTIAAGLMLSSENPVYTVEQVYDLSQYESVREKYAAEALKLAMEQNSEQLREALFTAGEKMSEYVKAHLETLNNIKPGDINKPEIREVAAVAANMYDAYQEFEHINTALKEQGLFMKTHSAEEIEKLNDEVAMLSQLAGNLKTGLTTDEDIERDGRGNIQQLSLENAMVEYFSSCIQCSILKDAMRNNKGKEVREYSQKYVFNSELAPTAALQLVRSKLFAGLLEDRSCYPKLLKGMINDTLAEDIGLKVVITDAGSPKVEADQQAICKKIGMKPVLKTA